MSRLSSALYLAVATALSLSAAACTDATLDPPVAGEAATVVASIERKDGSQVRWIAEPGGSVAITEVTTMSPSVTEILLDGERATPLEVFLALAPADAAVPAALTAHHQAEVGDAEPRALAAPLASVHVLGFNDCTATSWTPWHNGATGTYASRSSSFYSTGGAITFTGYINGQHRRRFDACAGTNVFEDLNVVINRRASGSGWVVVDTQGISHHERYYYTSIGGAITDWQMLVNDPFDGTTRSYGVGGAWTPELPITGG